MMVRYEQMKEAYPPTLPQAQAQAQQRPFTQMGIEHPLIELYKARTGEKRAACSAADLQRFAGLQFAKGESVSLEIKLKVFAGRLLERKLANLEEITQAMEGATFDASNETQAQEIDCDDDDI